ncbi:MAG: hypothetical protein FWF69_08665 [Firmicutes bacterium]|nr:hypothetical protein [Bacillota bacterium]
MKAFALYRVELRRLALSKFTWIAAGLSVCGPLFGYDMYVPSSTWVMTGKYIANPVLAGAVLWAVLSMLESDRIYRAKTDVLTDAVLSPDTLAASRMFAVMTLCAAVSLLTALVYLPYTMNKVGYLFELGLYAYSFLIVLLPTWWISILLAAALYQITRRIELAGLLYAVCVYFSFSQFFGNHYFTHWINPIILSYSDGFSNASPLRITLYTRFIWLAIAGGAFALSLLCMRRYQKNLLGSIARGVRKIYIPITAAALVSAGVFLWTGQPFVDHGPIEYDYEYRYRRDVGSSNTRVSSASYRLEPNVMAGRLKGRVTFDFTKYGEGEDWIAMNPGYTIAKMTVDGDDIPYKTLIGSEVNGERKTVFTLPPVSARRNLVVEYEGFPSSAKCFPLSVTTEISLEYISLINDGVGPFSTSFVPCASSTWELILPSGLTPVVDHVLLENPEDNHNGTKTWRTTIYRYGLPWILAADFDAITFEAAGTAVELIYAHKYDRNMREYGVSKAIADVMNYCTEHQGKLGFAKGKRLVMLQRSAMFGGGNAGDGWVEWSEDIFTQSNLSDPLKGASAMEVFAHEIIHEWWGGLGVVCGEYDDPFYAAWSDEGLTVYTTYRLMKEKYGELYAAQNYIDVWQAAVDKQNRGFYYRHPEYLAKLPEQYQAQLNSEARETNQYCRMPLMILKAERLVGGEAKFDEILQAIHRQYASTGQMFTYQDFLDACDLREEDVILEQDFQI